MITTGNIWHSPPNAFGHVQKVAESVGWDEIEKNRKYQPMRETKIGTVMALAMFKCMGKPTYLQLYKPDPPDVILMQQSKEIIGQLDLIKVEITSYMGQPDETLLERLQRSKIPPGINLYSDEYILLVELGIGMDIDYAPIRDYLNSNGVPFPVWTLQEVQGGPDTIARLVAINPQIRTQDLNIGEAMYLFQQEKLPNILVARRAGSVESVRTEKSEGTYGAPWETIGQ
jgi:hypothetical protein